MAGSRGRPISEEEIQALERESDPDWRPPEPERAGSLLLALDAARHRIPFWWWLTYDALVAVVIMLGFFGFRAATLWLGFAVLAVAVAIDTVEFIVKRPGARAKLKEAERAAKLSA